MVNTNYAVIVKVNDLDTCRTFYRELLGLGEPVVDSSYVVVFELHPGLSLMLEKSDAKYLEHGSSATGWLLKSDDIESLRFRLETAEFEYSLEQEPHLGNYLRGRDPEGNLFRVVQK